MTEFSRIPTVEHFVILTQENYSVDDGYGGYYQKEDISYEAFTETDTKAFQARVEQLTRKDKSFKVFKSTPAKVSVEVKVLLE